MPEKPFLTPFSGAFRRHVRRFPQQRAEKKNVFSAERKTIRLRLILKNPQHSKKTSLKC